MSGAIRPHKCQSEYQDRVYGKGKRYMNPRSSDKGGYRCTVCGQDYTGPVVGKKK